MRDFYMPITDVHGPIRYAFDSIVGTDHKWFCASRKTDQTITRRKLTRTDTGPRVCGDYILKFRELNRLIDRLTEKMLDG